MHCFKIIVCLGFYLSFFLPFLQGQDFKISKKRACFDSAVKFTPTKSTKKRYTYFTWDFGDGIVSNKDEPEHVYSPDPGKGLDTFVVTLNYFDSEFNGDSTKDTVYIYKPIAFKKEFVTFCEGDSAKLQLLDTVNPGRHFNWLNADVRDSTKNAIYVDDPGYYKLRAEDYNGCVSTDSIKASEFLKPQINGILGKRRKVCESEKLRVNRENASIFWSNGDTLSTITVKSPGIYWVSVTNDVGCRSYDSVFIAVKEKPEFDLDSNFSVCEGKKLTAVSTKRWDSVIWVNQEDTFRTAEPNIFAQDTGWYQVEAYQNPCKVYDSTYATTIDTPVAKFTYQGSRRSLAFNNTSENFTSSLWDFGDGSTSTKTNPSHYFQVEDPTRFKINLKVSNQCFQDDTSKNITISPVGYENGEVLQQNFKIYPNPFKERFYLKFSKSIKSSINITIKDIHGRSLMTRISDLNSRGNAYFKCSSLSSGIYNVIIQNRKSGELIGSEKVIKQ